MKTLVAAIALLCLSSTVPAHDIYSNLRDRDGHLCCGGQDCKPVEAVVLPDGNYHAGTNGRQRGTSRREDALDTVIALRRPEDYSPEQGARFEVHFEKLRNRVDGNGAVAFEARIETADGGE